ncbi:hypothetical protein DPEC_G00333650 [Dallia pectoralis]|uniref:Uncharacterized protein n=1 Tax=Dallia pectoralis TaxID=75939 RepID=A0ACC2F6D3_DALPE|nr:hypothetical protein DPEC_G00333650 [Dallia pectoralis]
MKDTREAEQVLDVPELFPPHKGGSEVVRRLRSSFLTAFLRNDERSFDPDLCASERKGVLSVTQAGNGRKICRRCVKHTRCPLTGKEKAGSMMSSDRDKVFSKGIAFDPCQLQDRWENREKKSNEKAQPQKRVLNGRIKEAKKNASSTLAKIVKVRRMVYCPLLKRFRLDPPLDAPPPRPPSPPPPKKTPQRVIPKTVKKPVPPEAPPPPLPKVILSYKDVLRRSELKWWRGIREKEPTKDPDCFFVLIVQVIQSVSLWTWRKPAKTSPIGIKSLKREPWQRRGAIMLSDKDEETVYDGFQLRNQWEKRAKQFSEKGQQEMERQAKSGLTGLYEKWQTSLANKNGTTFAEKKGKRGDMSDFRKAVVIPDTDVHNNIATFKVVPPPKIPKPAPPTPAKKQPPKRVKPKVHKPSGGWDKSWMCLKPTEQEVQSEEKWWRDFKPDRYLPLSDWARPFKCRPLLFSNMLHQQTEYWQLIWPAFSQGKNDKLQKDRPLQDEVNLQEWRDAWKTLRKQPTENLIVQEIRKLEVFLPGWNTSWKVASRAVQNNVRCLKDWHESWNSCKQHNWDTRNFRFMTKWMPSNELLGSRLNEDIPNVSKWIVSWKCVKLQPQSQETQLEAKKTESEFDLSNVPLHLHFRNLKTSFSNWHRAWKVSTADSEVKEGGWKRSWKICRQDLNIDDTKYRRDVVFFSTKHNTRQFLGVHCLIPNEWSESWRTVKPSRYAETLEEENETIEEDGHNDSSEHVSYLMGVPLYDWAESWRLKIKDRECLTLPRTEPPLAQKTRKERLPVTTTSPIEPYEDIFKQASWGDSWKILKPPKKAAPFQKTYWKGFKQDGDLRLKERAKPFKCRPLLLSHLLHRQTVLWHQERSTFNRKQRDTLLSMNLFWDEVNLPEWKDFWKTSKPLPKQHTKKRAIAEKGKPEHFLLDLKDSQHLPVSPNPKLSNELLCFRLDGQISSSPEWRVLEISEIPTSTPVGDITIATASLVQQD